MFNRNSGCPMNFIPQFSQSVELDSTTSPSQSTTSAESDCNTPTSDFVFSYDSDLSSFMDVFQNPSSYYNLPESDCVFRDDCSDLFEKNSQTAQYHKLDEFLERLSDIHTDALHMIPTHSGPCLYYPCTTNNKESECPLSARSTFSFDNLFCTKPLQPTLIVEVKQPAVSCETKKQQQQQQSKPEIVPVADPEPFDVYIDDDEVYEDSLGADSLSNSPLSQSQTPKKSQRHSQPQKIVHIQPYKKPVLPPVHDNGRVAQVKLTDRSAAGEGHRGFMAAQTAVSHHHLYSNSQSSGVNFILPSSVRGRSPSEIIKRSNHNSLERRRREDLRGMLLELRGLIPNLLVNDRSSRVQVVILERSKAYIDELLNEERALQDCLHQSKVKTVSLALRLREKMEQIAKNRELADEFN